MRLTKKERLVETIKEFTAEVSIKKGEYRTGMKGEVFYLAHLNPNKEINKRNINAVLFKDLDMRKTLSKGAKVKMQFSEQMIPEVTKVIKEPLEVTALPETCVTCGSHLKMNSGGHLACPNYYCSATSRGFLFRMIRIANPQVSLKLIEKYLDGYVYNGMKTPIDNPYEFMVTFKEIDEKNTTARENQWKLKHPENYELLFKIDVAMQNFLRKEKFHSKTFWEICNFPQLSEDQLDRLGFISPQNFIEGNCRKEFLNLDKHCRKLLEDNLDFIIFLFNWFKDYGDKEWGVYEEFKID
jgi:hypothetical protein